MCQKGGNKNGETKLQIDGWSDIDFSNWVLNMQEGEKFASDRVHWNNVVY